MAHQAGAISIQAEKRWHGFIWRIMTICTRYLLPYRAVNGYPIWSFANRLSCLPRRIGCISRRWIHPYVPPWYQWCQRISFWNSGFLYGLQGWGNLWLPHQRWGQESPPFPCFPLAYRLECCRAHQIFTLMLMSLGNHSPKPKTARIVPIIISIDNAKLGMVDK